MCGAADRVLVVGGFNLGFQGDAGVLIGMCSVCFDEGETRDFSLG